jgi:hypothetical protein
LNGGKRERVSRENGITGIGEAGDIVLSHQIENIFVTSRSIVEPVIPGSSL